MGARDDGAAGAGGAGEVLSAGGDQSSGEVWVVERCVTVHSFVNSIFFFWFYFIFGIGKVGFEWDIVGCLL